MILDTLYNKVKKQSLEILKLNEVSNLSKGFSENILTRVSLTGVVTPWNQELSNGGTSDYKLVCNSGLEYFIVADRGWREVLATFCWQEVKVIGLLNVSDMILIPQKVYPKGPEAGTVVDIASWKSKEFIKKFFKNANDQVVVPAAVLAVMAS